MRVLYCLTLFIFLLGCASDSEVVNEGWYDSTTDRHVFRNYEFVSDSRYIKLCKTKDNSYTGVTNGWLWVNETTYGSRKYCLRPGEGNHTVQYEIAEALASAEQKKIENQLEQELKLKEKNKKLEERKQKEIIADRTNTCEAYGFTRGTELFQSCILEIMQTERELLIKEKELEIAKANSKTNSKIAMDNEALNKQIRLQNSLNALRMLNDLATPQKPPPSISCITNPAGWTCF